MASEALITLTPARFATSLRVGLLRCPCSESMFNVKHDITTYDLLVQNVKFLNSRRFIDITCIAQA
jgi:hypothetical protein